jgi:hypothetical protein
MDVVDDRDHGVCGCRAQHPASPHRRPSGRPGRRPEASAAASAADWGLGSADLVDDRRQESDSAANALSLGLHSTRPEHGHVVVAAARDQRVQERRPADARVSIHDERAPSLHAGSRGTRRACQLRRG